MRIHATQKQTARYPIAKCLTGLEFEGGQGGIEPVSPNYSSGLILLPFCREPGLPSTHVQVAGDRRLSAEIDAPEPARSRCRETGPDQQLTVLKSAYPRPLLTDVDPQARRPKS